MRGHQASMTVGDHPDCPSVVFSGSLPKYACEVQAFQIVQITVLNRYINVWLKRILGIHVHFIVTEPMKKIRKSSKNCFV